MNFKRESKVNIDWSTNIDTFFLPLPAVKVLTILQKAGYEGRLVGGYVRDFLFVSYLQKLYRTLIFTTSKELSSNHFTFFLIYLLKITYQCYVILNSAYLRFIGSDIDIATVATPQKVIEIFTPTYKVVPVGLEHGTVTIVLDGSMVEVTTLRRDIFCDGRHASVEFQTASENAAKNWRIDAARRDFTINALYADLNGIVYDYYGGVVDLMNFCVRFIGDGSARIEEDHLRMVRYCRFITYIGSRIPVQSDWDIICQKAPLIEKISEERVMSELKKILLAQHVNLGANLLLQSGLLMRLSGNKQKSPTLKKVINNNSKILNIDILNINNTISNINNNTSKLNNISNDASQSSQNSFSSRFFSFLNFNKYCTLIYNINNIIYNDFAHSNLQISNSNCHISKKDQCQIFAKTENFKQLTQKDIKDIRNLQQTNHFPSGNRTSLELEDRLLCINLCLLMVAEYALSNNNIQPFSAHYEAIGSTECLPKQTAIECLWKLNSCGLRKNIIAHVERIGKIVWLSKKNIKNKINNIKNKNIDIDVSNNNKLNDAQNLKKQEGINNFYLFDEFCSVLHNFGNIDRELRHFDYLNFDLNHQHHDKSKKTIYQIIDIYLGLYDFQLFTIIDSIIFLFYYHLSFSTPLISTESNTSIYVEKYDQECFFQRKKDIQNLSYLHYLLFLLTQLDHKFQQFPLSPQILLKHQYPPRKIRELMKNARYLWAMGGFRSNTEQLLNGIHRFEELTLNER